MRIISTNSINENKIKCVIAGLSGAGKTSQAATLKKAGHRPLIISAESGLRSLSDFDIDYIDVTRDDAGNLIPKEQRIKRLMDVYNLVNTPEIKEKYDTLFPDSLSELCQLMFDGIRAQHPDNKDNMIVYGLLAQKMKDLLRAFRDIPGYHVVFTCLTKIEKDPEGRRFAGFELIGSISDKLAGYFDEVLYLRINQEGKREFVCSGTDSIVAKDRSGKLDKIEPGDLGKIFNKILGVV